MHYEFGEGYEVVYTRSQNNHPDRPQDLVIKLTDDEFAKLKNDCSLDGITQKFNNQIF